MQLLCNAFVVSESGSAIVLNEAYEILSLTSIMILDNC